jgi:hypothetical protein
MLLSLIANAADKLFIQLTQLATANTINRLTPLRIMGEFTKRIQLATNVTTNKVIELKAIKFCPQIRLVIANMTNLHLK